MYVVYNPKTSQIRIAEYRPWRVKVFREICLLGKTGRCCIKLNYLSNKYIMIGKF